VVLRLFRLRLFVGDLVVDYIRCFTANHSENGDGGPKPEVAEVLSLSAIRVPHVQLVLLDCERIQHPSIQRNAGERQLGELDDLCNTQFDV